MASTGVATAADAAADLTGRVCVVTGATQGIGRETAAALAAAGATVVAHGRDPAAVERVCTAIAAATGNDRIDGVVGRFDSLTEVANVAREILSRYDRLDVLVNNAGTGSTRLRRTEDGHEWLFGVNHLAPFLLTNLLLERLVASAPARIVTVASAAHRRAKLDLDDPDWRSRRFRSLQAYSDSKLANILFTRELARRLAGSGVTANSLHPGVVATNIFRGLGPLGRVFDFVARRWLLTAEEGARTTIHLAAAPDRASVNGEYFVDCAPRQPSAAALDDSAAARLWAISSERVGLVAPGR